MISFILVFSCLCFVNIKLALQMFQQNRYEFYRYTHWLFNKKNIEFNLSLIIFVLLLISAFINNKIICFFLCIVSAILLIYQENKKEYIKDLVLTARVKRQIVFISILFILTAFLFLSILKKHVCFVAPILFYMPYLLIYPMAVLTYPMEEFIKKRYEKMARKILDGMNRMMKIGITGSFGKTTTKNVVSDIIGESYYTLMTPASYNTPMGITRTIREYLKPIHEVFVCEMGADHVGEITYLMNFVKPKYGIVTSIGPQHLNTFGSLDNIIREKMQMIELLPVDGVGVLNIDNEYIRDYKIKNSCKIVTIGIYNENADYFAHDIHYSREGCDFLVNIDDEEVLFKTILLGEHNIQNLLCGIALARELGISVGDLQKNVAKVRRVEHRLELKKINGHTFIDNAFNSNPVGCKRSLDVLKMMGGQRVIVTPGLIDLGKEEDEANYQFGAYMKERADWAVLVGEKQTKAIYKGLMESGYDMEKVVVVDTVKEAFNFVYQQFGSEDTILLENDLPDAFNK